MNQNPKRIVIIEGDAFDADAIVAIVKYNNQAEYGIVLATGSDVAYDYGFADAPMRDKAMAVAVAAWRDVDLVYAPPPAHPEPLPFPPVINEPEERPDYWSDEKGRFFETYGGLPISIDGNSGERFIWNEGPPRRKNPLGPGASPIVKVYIGQDGQPMDPQPS